MGDPDDKRRGPPEEGRPDGRPEGGAERKADAPGGPAPDRPSRLPAFLAEAPVAMSVPVAFRKEVLPRLGRPARGRSGFGAVLDRILMRRGLRASQLAAVLGVTPSYLSALVTGQKPVSPDRIEEIAGVIGAEPSERAQLHRAAARDMGFRLDLPEDF